MNLLAAGGKLQEKLEESRRYQSAILSDAEAALKGSDAVCKRCSWDGVG